MREKDFFCSWSGGKDSCLALYRAIELGLNPKYLFTMFTERGVRSRSHGLHIDIVKAQSKALDIPLKIGSATWDDYEKSFIGNLKEMKSEKINLGVFGDIDIEEHKQWVENTCNEVDVRSFHPLWKEKRVDLVYEFINKGFKGIIIVVNEKFMKKKYLGRILDKELIRELQYDGVDPCGESGEFHTLVFDGPIFRYPLKLHTKQKVSKNEYNFLDIDFER